MVRPRAFARRQLVQARAEQLRTELRADARHPVPVALALLLAFPRVLGEEVEDVHIRILYRPAVPLLTLALSLLLPQHGVLVPSRSLGGVRLGMTHSQVQRVWGPIHGRCRACVRETWYFNYEKFHAEGAAVRFRKGRVDAAWTLWKPPGWHVGRLELGAPSAAIAARWGALVTIPCGSYTARILTKGRVTTVLYVYADQLWGFGLSRPDASPCH